MKTLPTWGGKSSFSYSCFGSQGVKIIYGKGFPVAISSPQFASLLNHFRGQTVNVGTSRTEAPGGSLGEWLQKNVTRTAIASYVAAILLDEGYAERAGGSNIKFK